MRGSLALQKPNGGGYAIAFYSAIGILAPTLHLL